MNIKYRVFKTSAGQEVFLKSYPSEKLAEDHILDAIKKMEGSNVHFDYFIKKVWTTSTGN